MQIQLDKIKSYSSKIPTGKIKDLAIQVRDQVQINLSKIKKHEPTVQEIRLGQLKKQLESTWIEVQQCEHNFENADKDYIDISIKQLDLAREKYNLLIKEYKTLTSTN